MSPHLSQSARFGIVTVSAGFCALLVTFMVAVTLSAGTGFQDFESLRTFGSIAAYNDAISDAFGVLSMIYPLDTLYIFSYITMVVVLADLAGLSGIAILAVLAALGTGVLDMVENNHIIMLASDALNGVPATIEQVQFENVVTQVKFNLGLLLTLTISFLIPQGYRLDEVARWLARGLVVAAPVALLSPVSTLAYIAMNIAFAGLISVVFARRWKAGAVATC